MKMPRQGLLFSRIRSIGFVLANSARISSGVSPAAKSEPTRAPDEVPITPATSRSASRTACKKPQCPPNARNPLDLRMGRGEGGRREAVRERVRRSEGGRARAWTVDVDRRTGQRRPSAMAWPGTLPDVAAGCAHRSKASPPSSWWLERRPRARQLCEGREEIVCFCLAGQTV